MYVAMKDLEIRGAGNILGAEQSGHIAGVGFDLYVRHDGRGRPGAEGQAVGRACRRSSPTSRSSCRSTRTSRTTTSPPSGCGWRPTSRIAAITSDDEIAAVRDELKDRYGPPPVEVENLLEVARFRVDGAQGRAHRRHAAGPVRQVRARASCRDSQQVRLQRLYPKSILKQATETLLVPVPKTEPLGGRPLRDLELLTWCGDLVEAMFLEPARGKLAAIFGGKGTHVKSIRVCSWPLPPRRRPVALTACGTPVEAGAAAVVGDRAHLRPGAERERSGVRGRDWRKAQIDPAQLGVPSLPVRPVPDDRTRSASQQIADKHGVTVTETRDRPGAQAAGPAAVARDEPADQGRPAGQPAPLPAGRARRRPR